MATYLATLRPSGDLGDHSDATYDALSDGGLSASLPFSWHAIADLTEGAVEFVRFYARASRDFAEQGPGEPTVGPAWRLGGAGTAASQTATLASTLPTTLGGADQTTDPDGNPWTLATLATVQMGLAAQTDAVSQIETTVTRYDLWAEVWGEPAGGSVLGAIALDGAAAVALAEGDAGPIEIDGACGVAVADGEAGPVEMDGSAAVAVLSGAAGESA